MELNPPKMKWQIPEMAATGYSASVSYETNKKLAPAVDGALQLCVHAAEADQSAMQRFTRPMHDR
jgi:hypothetical protein